jgi:hypothetical protein
MDLCFYHKRDLDGHCSAAIVKNLYPNCELIGVDYGEIFQWDKIKTGVEVCMVDFSLPVKDMRKLNKKMFTVYMD